MSKLHLEFCDGKSWLQLLDKKVPLNSSDNAGQAAFWIISSVLKGEFHLENEQIEYVFSRD